MRLIFILLLAATISWTASAHAQSVMIFTDCGADIDDQWVLAEMSRSPQFDIQAIIPSFTPPPHSQTSDDTAECVSDWLPPASPLLSKIYLGASHPLTPIDDSRQLSAGSQKLIEIASNFNASHRLIVMTLGPGTDVAGALRLHPEIEDQIKIVGVGFDSYPEGRDTWNVVNDPLAWEIILKSNAPVQILSKDVTQRDLMLSRTESQTLFAGTCALGKRLDDLHKTWINENGPFAESITHLKESWPIWDLGAISAVENEVQSVRVARPQLNSDLSFNFSQPNSAEFEWVISIERKGAFKRIRATALQDCASPLSNHF